MNSHNPLIAWVFTVSLWSHCHYVCSFSELCSGKWPCKNHVVSPALHGLEAGPPSGRFKRQGKLGDFTVRLIVMSLSNSRCDVLSPQSVLRLCLLNQIHRAISLHSRHLILSKTSSVYTNETQPAVTLRNFFWPPSPPFYFIYTFFTAFTTNSDIFLLLTYLLTYLLTHLLTLLT
jgi:hypothetical protein